MYWYALWRLCNHFVKVIVRMTKHEHISSSSFYPDIKAASLCTGTGQIGKAYDSHTADPTR
jgi:hypothetical protein